MPNIRHFLPVLMLLGTLAPANAQSTDSQVFNVDIPTLVSIAAPSTESFDMNNPSNQINGAVSFLDTAPWVCTSNSDKGATVEFEAQGPFTNSLGGAPIDATLSIYGIQSDPNGVWSVTIPSASTSGAGTTALVQATSTLPGPADFDVDITFNNPGGFTDLVAGTYTTTVSGTISGN